MIALDRARKVFAQGRPNEFTALHETSLVIEADRLTVIRGPSGSGKTTLLTLIGCMARPTSGRIHVLGREITSLPERFLTEIRRKTFGFIFQHFNLIPGLTALENVILPAYPTSEKRASLEKRAARLFELFGLGPKAGSPIECLSGGEAQRVTIARALINDPAVVIADEPTAHLDSKLSREFMDTMARLRSEGRTVLIASHDPLVTDHPAVERVFHIRDGRIDGEGA
ncbi:MAG TPA: ABC transporter ATP-binding protein [Acidobacteriota bacterium]|nr:ABC transporter ATP-binding protein [Acidobacteriota bacterium]